jgi:hypothetical protein
VALHLDPFEHQPLHGEQQARVGDISEEWRVASHGIEVIAHGALVCPGCRAPMVVATTTPVQSELECGFCGHTGRARTFLVRDVFDTVSNEAYLVARLRV